MCVWLPNLRGLEPAKSTYAPTPKIALGMSFLIQMPSLFIDIGSRADLDLVGEGIHTENAPDIALSGEPFRFIRHDAGKSNRCGVHIHIDLTRIHERVPLQGCAGSFDDHISAIIFGRLDFDAVKNVAHGPAPTTR